MDRVHIISIVGKIEYVNAILHMPPNKPPRAVRCADIFHQRLITVISRMATVAPRAIVNQICGKCMLTFTKKHQNP